MSAFDKFVTDVFDAIARVAGQLTAGGAPEAPDVSRIDVTGLVPDEAIGDPRAFFRVSDAAPDMDLKLTRKLPLADVLEGSFPSSMQTHFPENNTVYVKHFRRRPARRGRPAVVVLNGLHVDKAFDFYFEWWCLRFAAWGMDSAMVTLPYSQARTPEGAFSGQYMILSDTRWTLCTVRQSFEDVQQYVNRLKADGAGPVGLFGVSYGGMLTGIYLCNAPSADFGILCMPPVDIQDIFSKWDFADELRAREAAGETTLLTDPRVPPLMSLCSMTPRIPNRKVFLAAGEFDHLAPPETVERTRRRWGAMPWLRMYPTGHINTFALNFRMIADLRRFVKTEIKPR